MTQVNLIIVDDEKLNADGVRMLITKSKLAVNIVGVFYSSTEALAFLEQNPVDIVVTDIKMPKITGLELIRRIKQLDADVEIIIFTGFGSLAYAQEAMQYGVKYFLEKPVLPAKLAASIAGSIANHQKHQQTDQLRQKQLIENVLLGEADMVNAALAPFTLVSLDGGQYERVHTVLEQALNRGERTFIRVAHGSQLLYCVFGAVNLAPIMVQIEQAQRGQCLVITVQTAVELTTLRQAALQSQQVLALAAYVTQPTLIKDATVPTTVQQQALIKEWQQTLEAALISGSSQAADDAYQAAVQAALASCVEPKRFFAAIYSSLIAALPAAAREEFQLAHPQPQTASTGRETVVQAVSIIATKAQDDAASGDIVANLDQIIAARYSESELSLKWVANHLLYLNPEYLGKRYLQRTGKKFSQALTEVRLTHAAELLLAGYKVIEVARAVGYENNPDYFGQQFKKHYQETPYRYQRQHTEK